MFLLGKANPAYLVISWNICKIWLRILYIQCYISCYSRVPLPKKSSAEKTLKRRIIKENWAVQNVIFSLILTDYGKKTPQASK